MDKPEIVKQIRPISLDEAMADADSLRARYYADALTPLSNAGLRFVDHFTFQHRLAVRGKMDMNFYDFLANWESFKERKYIKNLLRFYNGDDTPRTIYKIYNLAINCIHAFRPVVALSVYERFKPTHILDPCCGWGGRALAAHVYGAAYTGYDCNTDLRSAYERMCGLLGRTINLNIGDSLLIDYDNMKSYDMVMTSPPYYDLENYAHNKWYSSDDEMDDQFYFPLFDMVRNHLQVGGWIVLSINEKLFNRVFDILYGPPHVRIPLPAYKRSAYTEWLYAWQK